MASAPTPFPDPLPGNIQTGQLTPNNAAYYSLTPQGRAMASTPIQGSASGGQVLGAQTSNTAPGLTLTPLNNQQQTTPSTGIGNATSASNQASYNDLLNTGTSAINAAYDPIVAQYDKILGHTEADRNALQQQVYDLFGTATDPNATGFDPTAYQTGQLGTLNRANQSTMNQLNQSSQQIDTRQAQSLRDLEQNLTNMAQGFGRQIGSVGAGDSSASGMGQYALARLGSQQRAQLLQQANDLHNQINQKLIDVKNAYQDQVGQLMNWRSQNLLQIQKDWQAQNDALEQQKANVNSQRAGQIGQLQTQLKSQALSNLQALQSQYQNYGSALQNSFNQNTQHLGNVDTQLSQLAGNPGLINQAGQFDPGVGNLGPTTIGTLQQLANNPDVVTANPLLARQRQKLLGF